ncbi:hypothetical protein [Bradyrhizobium sp.]|uniref:hypothetical protein n=1 Tax=Bradyrhizobium sp. TaxID=376 RepID=UPI0023A50469|nr:hypothetical protein [Bradyrhizobium sp.]MDE2376783.1 hypothetical protein [Bradyrhizobium sp.]
MNHGYGTFTAGMGDSGGGGELEIGGKDIGGIALHAAARVMAKADADEMPVSGVVTGLVAGAGLKFLERGSCDLKGLSGCWDPCATVS